MMNYETLIPIVEAAIDLARRNPKPEDPCLPDDYVAWVILNEIRRSGFAIVPDDSGPENDTPAAAALTG